MSYGSPYQPDREPFFALKYIRLMAKSGASERMGGMAFALCCIVASYQDVKRFKAPATFFNNVIMGMLAVSKLDTFINVRNRAIAEGWLGYESAGGSRMPGKYWVTIPSGIEEMSDVAGDDGYGTDSAVVTVPENRESCDSTVPENRESNGIRESERLPPRLPKNGSASGVERGAFLPIPIPKPKNPLTPKGGSGDSELSEEKTSKRPAKSKQATLADVTIPETLNTPTARRCLETWLAYKQEAGKPYRRLGLQSLVTHWAELGEPRLSAAVNHSMSNGWAGLYEPKNNGHTNGHGSRRANNIDCQLFEE